jgi:hypothetical protein
MPKRYTVVIDDIFYFSSSNLIKAMAERAIALRKYSQIHRISLLIEEL